MGEALGNGIDDVIVVDVTKSNGGNQEVTEEEDKVSNTEACKEMVEDAGHLPS